MVAAIVREPAAFLLSLYKLDVLHGRTREAFETYWPRKLSDPRLRYGGIAAALMRSFAQVKMLDFDALSRDGRLVANALANFGLPSILQRAGVPSLEAHRSRGAAVFADAPVSMMLFAANRIGLRTLQARRELVLDRIMALAARDALQAECRALSIPLDANACRAITESTAAEVAAFTRITGLALPPSRSLTGQRQSVIEATSPLGKALVAELDRPA
jgi:hypothetical protein